MTSIQVQLTRNYFDNKVDLTIRQDMPVNDERQMAEFLHDIIMAHCDIWNAAHPHKPEPINEN
jgi:hypothetical protein